MKFIKQNIKSLTVLALVVFTSACSNDYLEVVPKGSLIAQSVNDYDRLLDDPSINVLGSDAVPMGDEVAAVEPFFSNADLKNQRLFKWVDEIYNVDQTPEPLTHLNAVYTYNKVINEVNDAIDGTDTQKKSLIAQAKIGRAITYFSLVNYYGKQYNEATAASDLGYPIIKEADITLKNFTRNTVKEVYDFIIGDITEAIPDLPKTLTKRNRVSLVAAEALLGKVLMFKRDFANALVHLENAAALMSSSKLTIGLYNYNDAFADGGEFMPINPFFGPNYPVSRDNTEVIYDKTIVNAWAFLNNEVAMSPHTFELYTASDLRFNFFTRSQAFGFGEDYAVNMRRRYSTLATPSGIFLPDIYLLTIEAKARLGNLNEAASDLESYRSNRMPLGDAAIAVDVKADQDKLIKYIFDERIREFAVYGYRWFDMRRLSVDTKYSGLVKYTHQVYDKEGNVLNTYELKPERLVMKFGSKIRSQNPGLIDNP